jgi:hypothetical protein
MTLQQFVDKCHTQPVAARLLGISTRTLSRWLVRGSNPRGLSRKTLEAHNIDPTLSKLSSDGYRKGIRVEDKVWQYLTDNGWTIIRNGWPDFAAIKGSQLKFVEVKSDLSFLSEAQLQMHRLLKERGFKVEVIKVLSTGEMVKL